MKTLKANPKPRKGKTKVVRTEKLPNWFNKDQPQPQQKKDQVDQESKKQGIGEMPKKLSSNKINEQQPNQ